MNAREKGPAGVPFADLHAQYLSIQQEVDEAIAAVIAKSAFIRGSFVECFEQEFAEAIGTSYCVSCANGTDALYISMVALGLKPGDEVIVPAMSWISTSETVTQAGGRVVFCDVDRVTGTIDVRLLPAKLTSRTVGIIPVHLYGHPADMDSIMNIAQNYGLWVLEDCAQAHLACYKGRRVGTFGVAGTFSFYPGKNLGAMGDAGAIVTSDAALAERMAMFARHGGIKKGDHLIEGINSRMDGLQAAILSVKLRHLECWTKARRLVATRYSSQLRDVGGLQLPTSVDGCEHVWHLFVVRHDRRDDLATFLRERNIQTVINYRCALPFLPCYRRFGQVAGDYPAAFELQTSVLSLPMFAEMRDVQIEQVVRAIHDFSVGV